jgi:glycosyltransferase involved in cell wall biosynthesis
VKTLYAIASRFAGPGIGRTASYAALGLWRAGALAQLVCLGHKPTEIDESIIADVGFPRRGALRPLPDKPYYEAKNLWFDQICKGKLHSELHTFHCWNSQAGSSLKKAKALGIRSVVDRASSHIRTQVEILAQRYRAHGIDYNPTYAHVVTRCLADYDEADLVVTPSPFAYGSFAEQGFDMNKVVLNPFGVDLEKFRPAESPPEKFTLTFLGQLGVRKGTFDLLTAWDNLKLPDAKLILAGGEEPASASMLAAWKNREDIKFLGYAQDAPALLASSSAFAFPSYEEGSALVTYEAMASGLPIVATYESGSVVENERSGFIIDSGDIDALSERIERLYNNHDLARDLGAAARKRIEAYPWEAYGERTAKLHQGLYEGKSTAAIQADLRIALPEIKPNN